MSSLQQEDFCFSIDEFEPPAVLARFDAMCQARERVVDSIDRIFSERRRQVDEQYDSVLGPVNLAGVSNGRPAEKSA